MSSKTDPHAQARLAAIVESSFDAIVSKDLNSIIQSWNPAAERLFGYTAEEAIGHSVMMLIPEHLRAEEVDIIRRVSTGERVDSFETIRRRKDGTMIAVSLTISPVRDRHGKIVGASKIARDITAAKESERKIRLLMREVNHRVKNQFAVILSMVRETTRRSIDPASLEMQIRDRIMALSRSHDLLVNSNWSGTHLLELLHEHLKPFGREDQISLSGPVVTLQPNAVQHLGIAFHELGTNSSKYGALSIDEGRLSVKWEVHNGELGKSEFELCWEETGIENASNENGDSNRKGFGTVVLQRVTPQALSGTSQLELDASRLCWRLSTPLSSMILDDPNAAAL